MVGLNGRGVGEVSLAARLASEVHEPEFLVGIVGGMIPVNGLIACGYALHVEGQHECRPMRCCLVASGLEGALETDVLSGEVDGRIELHRIGHHDVLGRVPQDDVLSGERLGHAGTSLEQIERVHVAAIADEVGLVGVAGIDEVGVVGNFEGFVLVGIGEHLITVFAERHDTLRHGKVATVAAHEGSGLGRAFVVLELQVVSGSKFHVGELELHFAMSLGRNCHVLLDGRSGGNSLAFLEQCQCDVVVVSVIAHVIDNECHVVGVAEVLFVTVDEAFPRGIPLDVGISGQFGVVTAYHVAISDNEDIVKTCKVHA